MKQYKKPLMKIVALEKVDVLTTSCPECKSKDWNGENHSNFSDGCNEGCTAHNPATGNIEE